MSDYRNIYDFENYFIEKEIFYIIGYNDCYIIKKYSNYVDRRP